VGTGDANAAVPSGALETGVNVFALWRDWEHLNALLDRTRDSGSGWLRVDLGWCTLEDAGPGRPEEWYALRIDTVVREAAARGLQVLIVVHCAPAWAGGGGDPRQLPEDLAEFGRVMTWLAARYAGRVAAWEIWNEPDCVGGCPNGSPAAYVPVLQAGYRGVKAGDPGAIVVSGGISGNNADWIERMYAAGAEGWFDALAVHPYTEPPSSPLGFYAEGHIYRLTTVDEVRDVMVRHGDEEKPIWFTELGWSTATSGPVAGVNEATQATYLAQALQLIEQNFPFVTHAFWFSLRDRDDSTPLENAYGLLRPDLSEKPAYAALQAANRALVAGSGPR
jgi:hypothetical protein